MHFTDDEKSVIKRSLAEAIISAIKLENLGPLTEYKASRRGTGWSEVDPVATKRMADIARGILATVLRGDWGYATMDGGILGAKPTRAEAVLDIGFATPYTRARSGRLYIYTSQEGTTATVGRVEDLLANGFEILPESRFTSR